MQLDSTIKRYQIRDKMIAGIYSGLATPTDGLLPSISNDLIEKFGTKDRKTLRRASPSKCIIKKPVFDVYMRMKTDREFRKNYIATHKIDLRDKQALIKKKAKKSASVFRKP